jgi:hypothetical protein
VVRFDAVVSSTPHRRLARGAPPAVLTALALLGLFLSTASIPHTHTGQGVGLYNQEHDLTYFATLGADVLAVAGSAVTIAPAVSSSGAPPATAVAASVWRYTDPRAPPLR